MDLIFSRKIILQLFVGVVLIALPAEAKVKGYFQCTNGKQEETTILPAETDGEGSLDSTTGFFPEITCSSSALPEVTNGTFNCTANSTISKNGVCSLTCEDGFYPAFSKQAVCETGADNREGVWSEDNFTCRAIVCSTSNLTVVSDGFFNCSSRIKISKGGVCNLTCNDGFYPVFTNQTVCEEGDADQGGVWSDGNFTCSEIKCLNSDLQNITTGSFNCPSEYFTRKKGACNLTCDEGLYPSPLNRAICVAGSGENGGEWYPENLSCRQIECTDWNQWGRNEYKVIIDVKTWDDSLQVCKNNSSHLVTIESKEENEVVQKLVKRCTTNPTWIGLRYRETNEASLKWSDGTDLTFSNWGGGHPPQAHQTEGDVHCVFINTNRGQWYNDKCSTLKPAVCRKNSTAS